MYFTFEHYIDPKDHKSGEEYKAIAIEVPSGQNVLTGCQGPAGSTLQK